MRREWSSPTALSDPWSYAGQVMKWSRMVAKTAPEIITRDQQNPFDDLWKEMLNAPSSQSSRTPSQLALRTQSWTPHFTAAYACEVSQQTAGLVDVKSSPDHTSIVEP